jgi:hypothetical protein
MSVRASTVRMMRMKMTRKRLKGGKGRVMS